MKSANRISMSARDRVFYTIAVILTAIWVILGLVPFLWGVSSAFKTSADAFRIPPTWLPKIPQRITLNLDYSKYDDGPSELLEKIRTDARVIEWCTFDRTQGQERIGEIVVKGFANGRCLYKSRLTYADYRENRKLITATTLMDPGEVRRRIPAIEKRKLVQEEIMPNLKEDSRGRTPLIEKLTAYWQDQTLSGEITALSQNNAWARFEDNFKVVWNSTNPEYTGKLGWGHYFLNSAWLTLITMGLVIATSVLAGYALSRLVSPRISRYLLLFYLVTMMVPSILTLIPLYLLMQKWGFINSYWGVILPSTASPFYIYLIKGFVDQLPEDLFDAAKLDGANDYQVFSIVAMPLCKPIITALTLNCFIGAWSGGDILYTYLILKSPKMWTYPVALLSTSMGGAVGPNEMALCIIASIPTLLLFAFFQKNITKGMLLGAIKG